MHRSLVCVSEVDAVKDQPDQGLTTLRFCMCLCACCSVASLLHLVAAGLHPPSQAYSFYLTLVPN